MFGTLISVNKDKIIACDYPIADKIHVHAWPTTILQVSTSLFVESKKLMIEKKSFSTHFLIFFIFKFLRTDKSSRFNIFSA